MIILLFLWRKKKRAEVEGRRWKRKEKVGGDDAEEVCVVFEVVWWCWVTVKIQQIFFELREVRACVHLQFSPQRREREREF